VRFPRLRTARLFFALMILGTYAVAQTVEGSVINSVTGNGIPAIRVEIRAAAGKTGYTTATDAQGHFLVEGVLAGTYTASSSSPDYSLSGAPSLFQVTAGETPAKLELRMVPLSRISGRVVDNRGEGVASAEVELIGSGRLFEESTDATGKFELHLLPGAYTLSVAPPRGLKQPSPGPDDDRVMVWARTFYPGGSRPEAASKIVAQPGGVIFVALKLQAVSVHAVRGVLLNPDGTPAPNVSITLSEETGQPVHRAESQSDGAFEFPAVADGEWHFAAAVENDGVKLRAVRWIEMEGHDLEGVRLRISPPFTVRGQVVMEMPSGMPAPNLPSVYLVPRGERAGWQSWMADWMQRPEMHFLEPLPANALGGDVTKQAQAEVLDSFQFLGAVSARPDAGGNFSFPNIYPGNYRIVPMPPPPPYYLDGVRVGETDLGGQEVELSSEVPVTVLYKTNGGTVRGTVEKCASGPVLLVPQETTRQRLGFLRAAQCDSNDRYGITGVRPGEYYALAFAGDGPLPELNEGLLKQASKVTVRAGEASLADLSAISRQH
jgi:Carboxypeptidase regulatory-like domain